MAVEARTGQLEQFVEDLKPGAGGGEQQSEALRQLSKLWQADNERALTTLRDELQQAEARFERDWPAGDDRVRDELRGELREVEQRLPAMVAAMQEDRRATVIEGAEIIEHLLHAEPTMLNRGSTFDGATPLMWAVRQGRERIVHSLVRSKVVPVTLAF